MSRKCSICEHLSRKDIDQLLIAGGQSYADIAIQFGTSKASLSRHKKNHLREQTAKAINHVLLSTQPLSTPVRFEQECKSLRIWMIFIPKL